MNRKTSEFCNRLYTPNLRVVTVKVNIEEKIVKICFFYNGEISEEDCDTANAAITEMISDFPPDYQLDDYIERIDYHSGFNRL